MAGTELSRCRGINHGPIMSASASLSNPTRTTAPLRFDPIIRERPCARPRDCGQSDPNSGTNTRGSREVRRLIDVPTQATWSSPEMQRPARPGALRSDRKGSAGVDRR